MAESEKITLEVEVKASGAVKELENVEKAANKAEEGLEGLKDTGEVSGNALVSSLKRLAGTFGLVLSAGAVVSFIKRVSEANLLLGQMAVRSGQSEKSIRAMQNQFKALGYSASEANSIVDDLAGSFAALKFGGELTGITKAFTDLGVSVMDAQGKARDLYDMAIEAGEFSLGFTGGDRESAMQLMMSRGISPALADMATRSDAREQARKMREEAAASKEASEQSEKLSRNLSRIGERFVAFINRLDESYGIFDKLNKALDALVPLGDGVYHVFDAIGKALTVIGNIFKAVIKPVIWVLNKFGNFVDKGDKEGFGIDELGTGPDDLDESVKKGAKAVGKKLESAGETADELHKSGFANDVGGFFEKLGEWGWDVDKWGGGSDFGVGSDSDLRERIKENLKKREGVRLKAYQDSGGVWTIGYGHTKGVKPGMTITKEQADAYLEQDMKTHVDAALDLYANHSDKTKMLAADLAYNAGIGAIQPGSRFSKLAQAGEISASDYSKLYTTSKGVFTPGLVNRRNSTYAEASRTPNVIMPRVQPAAYSVAPATTKVSQSAPTVTQNITVYAPSTEASEIVAEIRNKTQNIGALTSVFV